MPVVCGLKTLSVAPVGSEGDVEARDWAVRRILLAGVGLAIVVAACGGPMSETEYVEGLNALVVTVASDLEAPFVAYEQIADPTLAEFVAFVDQEIAVEYAVRQGFEALDPPDSIADVHQVMADGLARLLAAAEGLVAVAGTVSSLEEVEQTPEFAEYQAAHADPDGICRDVEAKLDDLAATSEALTDIPWMPTLRLTVEVALGCGEFATG